MRRVREDTPDSGRQKASDCAEPEAISKVLKKHGKEKGMEKLKAKGTKIVTIQCKASKTKDAGDNKPPCRYCKSMLDKMGLKNKVSKDARLRKKCMKSSGGKCK